MRRATPASPGRPRRSPCWNGIWRSARPTLERKKAEFEQWVKRREEFLKKADESVVAIYSQMRPDAASQQIAAMDPEAAAAILAKLSPRIASAILNEMNPAAAAQLTNAMAGLPGQGGKQGQGRMKYALLPLCSGTGRLQHGLRPL